MTDTVAIYMKPPAVKGRIHKVAELLLPSAKRPQMVPAIALVAVVSCRNIACRITNVYKYIKINNKKKQKMAAHSCYPYFVLAAA